MSRGGGQGLVVIGICLLTMGSMYAIPYVLRQSMPNTQRKDGMLTGSQRQRGMFLNANSIDVGPDPDWNLKTGKWEGKRNSGSV